MFRKIDVFSLMVSAAAVLPAAAAAQSAAPAACELHFWPAGKAHSSNYSGVGGAGGGLLAGKRMTGEEALLADLPPEEQAEALRAIDLRGLLGLPAPVEVILEAGPLESKTAKSQKSRLTASTADCYVELAVKQILYTSHITAGRQFGAKLILRRYSGRNSPARVADGIAGVRVKLYPARTEADRPAANAELKQNFGRTAEKFLLAKGQRKTPGG